MSAAQSVASPATLQANIAALARFNPQVALKLCEIKPRPDVVFLETQENALSAQVGELALASRRRPLAEARTFADTIDISQAGMYLVAGCGLGYHVRELLDRLKRQGLVMVFEPDAKLLRAVLERIDCTAWIGEPNLRLIIDADDRALMVNAVQGAEGYIGLGVRLIEHPASKPRLREAIGDLYRHLIDVIESVKMCVMTTLMQVRVTMRNLTQNLDMYSASGGIADLAGICRGRPGLVVSAGPSLARNIDLLARPGLRERFAIVATQTVLKPLLRRGIKPHFITTLDWSDVGKRFYEGLTPSEVEGVTLIADPKVNPSVLEAWAGAGGKLRCIGEAMCDRILGESSIGAKGLLQPGATVAHLAYYVARHLGCDPVALVGQDLGFTDAQYYASGASIHGVWAGEINEFNTLEMLEWQRIVRQGEHLRPATDVLGRPMYTDEQMLTYLTQFERDFSIDAARGLSIVDATEGGVRKQHTTVQTLAEFVGAHWREDAGAIVIPPVPPTSAMSREKMRKRVREVRQQVFRVGELSREAAVYLAQIGEHNDDQARVNRLIARIEPLTKEVVKLDPGYTLVHTLGQTVAFNRLRADRTLEIDQKLDPYQRQQGQAERDLANVRALSDTAEQLGELLDLAVGALEGKPKITRDRPSTSSSKEGRQAGRGASEPARDIVAIIPVDPTDSSLLEPLAGSLCPLALTVARLRRARNLGSIALVGEDVRAIRRFAEKAGVGDHVQVLAIEPGEFGPRRRYARRARALAGACWRGGIGNATCYDEVLLPGAMPAILERLEATGAIVLGPDWCMVDPGLADALIDRHRESPEDFHFVFTQAAPGLVPCLISRLLSTQLAPAPLNDPRSTAIGAAVGYVPQAPMNDPIAGPGCIGVPASMRDAGRRCIFDNAPSREMLARICASKDPVQMSAAEFAEALLVESLTTHAVRPEHLEIELSPTEPRRMAGAAPGQRPDETCMRRVIDELFKANPRAVLTLAVGGDDASSHELLSRLVAHARTAGVGCVHARTSLRCDPGLAAQLLESRPDIVSADLLAQSAEIYQTIVGADDFERVSVNAEWIMANAGPASPFFIPRFTRRDAAYAELEPFYAKWLARAGWCVIESAPSSGPIGSERFSPLTRPTALQLRDARERLSMLADGAVLGDPHWRPGAAVVADLRQTGIAAAWSKAIQHRERNLRGNS